MGIRSSFLNRCIQACARWKIDNFNWLEGWGGNNCWRSGVKCQRVPQESVQCLVSFREMYQKKGNLPNVTIIDKATGRWKDKNQCEVGKGSATNW